LMSDSDMLRRTVTMATRYIRSIHGGPMDGKRPRVVVVGGVAGGASCAARLRRLAEYADISVYDKGSFVSFANCGLPYYVGNTITAEDKLVVATPDLFHVRNPGCCAIV
jgi:hypothetical protein